MKGRPIVWGKRKRTRGRTKWWSQLKEKPEFADGGNGEREKRFRGAPKEGEGRSREISF